MENEKQLRKRTTNKQAVFVRGDTMQSDAWITPYEADLIRRRAQNGVLPVFLIEGYSCREFTEELDSLAKKLSAKQQKEIKIRASYIKEGNVAHYPLFVMGTTPYEFLKSIDEHLMEKYLRLTRYNDPKRSKDVLDHNNVYVVCPDFSLVRLCDFDKSTLIEISRMPQKEAPEFEETLSVEEEVEAEREEEAEKPKAPATPRKRTTIKVSDIKKRIGQPRERRKATGTVMPLYVRSLKKAEERYGDPKFGIHPMSLEMYQEKQKRLKEEAKQQALAEEQEPSTPEVQAKQ